ncbi:serine/threonine-protein kinase 40-like isoform X2 [Hermetia illucens]|uniref:serine/threonine-protein kinase 40-like isoform X2 n=1 Tax=Hermetia illucens TaxID=343691 RepID=UPI0018CC0B14|nr:serine/threonine-protein kinase 40-like isoform X2 [Hermetia illucens]
MSNIRMNNPGSIRDRNCPPSENRQRLNNGGTLLPRGPMPPVIRAPFLGMPVNRKQFRRAGSYIIGPEVRSFRPAQCLLQYIARKQNTNHFFLLKIVQQSTRPNKDLQAIYDEQRGKAMLHTEYSLLSLLQDDPGVIKQHGIFSDVAYEDMIIDSGQCIYTGAVVKRHILVLECLEGHQFCDESTANITLCQYLQAGYVLFEGEALYIFHAIIQTIENVHEKNIVHRDLRPENITLNRFSKRVKITNFWLGRFLSDKNLVLYDSSGTPNFISPEIIAGKPYKGKPADMWALGIILFTMLYGRLPFYKPTNPELFEMIGKGEYQIPEDKAICSHTIEIIKGLLNVDPEARLTATQVRVKLESILAMKRVKTLDQCVPEEESTPKPAQNSEEFADSSDYDQVVPVFIPKDKLYSKLTTFAQGWHFASLELKGHQILKS